MHTHTHLPPSHVWVRRMPQREPHADTPSTPCWARCGGSHTGIPFRVVYQTHKHNTAVFNMPHFMPTASSDDCSMWLLSARPMRTCTVPRVSTKSTRCEHSHHPIWVALPVLERPMRVLRVFMRASKELHAGIHSIHESTRIILSDHLQYPCVYSEYRM